MAIAVHVLQSPPEYGKEIYQNVFACAKPLFCSLNFFFRNVFVARHPRRGFRKIRVINIVFMAACFLPLSSTSLYEHLSLKQG